MLFRTLRFRKQLKFIDEIEMDDVNVDDIVGHLSEAIKIPTISTVGMEDSDRKPFLVMHEWIKKTYPLVNKNLVRRIINQYSLLYIWKGSDDTLKPVLFNAHLDVVPVVKDNLKEWNTDPFAGDIKDGYVWGRGTLDMKNQLVAILDSVERLIKDGYSPRRTIYLAFGHDEEISGYLGSKLIVEDLKMKGIQFAAVLDEGGLLTERILDGIDEQVGLIGMTEKGYVTLVLSAQSKPGHSSVPPRQTAIGIIARAIALLDDNPMPARLDYLLPMLENLGHLFPFGKQFVIANAWLFKTILLKRFLKSPQMNAMIRTTHAATMIEGGIKDNILPSSASAKVNCRILPGDKVEDVIDHFKNTINDPRVSVTLDEHSGGWEASDISSITDPAYLSLELVIKQIFKNVTVAPFTVLAATDSRYYKPICKNIYRFSPTLITPENRSSVHGINERIQIDDLGNMVVFFMRLMKVWGEAEF